MSYHSEIDLEPRSPDEDLLDRRDGVSSWPLNRLARKEAERIAANRLREQAFSLYLSLSDTYEDLLPSAGNTPAIDGRLARLGKLIDRAYQRYQWRYRLAMHAGL